jgi:hypothetical protein
MGRGERPVVPRAEFSSYYDRPVLQQPAWGAPDVTSYLFLGGLAGASSVLAGFSQLTGNPELARVGKLAGVGAIGLSGAVLVKDLGRPRRFLNMLRVFKVTSPMSVGSWLLSAYGSAASLALACSVTGRLPRTGAVATGAATAFGSGVATYTAALIGNTAVPAWHAAHPELPYLFAGSAAAAAGGLGLVAVPRAQAGPAVRFALLGSVAELTAKNIMFRRLGEVAEPYRSGRPMMLIRASQACALAGMVGSVLPTRKRTVSAASGAALLASSALTRFGVFEAGLRSTRDPAYTVGPQRRRLRERADPAA